MTAPTLQQLAHDLHAADGNARALALAGLVSAGRAATAVLLAQVHAPASAAPARALAAQGLAEIADPAAAEALRGLLGDGDPLVRGRAAQALARIGAPDAIAALVRTLNDVPDPLRAPHTLATYLLIERGERGEAVLPALAPLLTQADPLTQSRAFLVLQSIVEARDGGATWRQLESRLGRIDTHTDAAAREACARRWRNWIEAQGPAAPGT